MTEEEMLEASTCPLCGEPLQINHSTKTATVFWLGCSSYSKTKCKFVAWIPWHAMVTFLTKGIAQHPRAIAYLARYVNVIDEPY